MCTSSLFIAFLDLDFPSPRACVHSFSCLSFPPHLDFPGPRACVHSFSFLSFPPHLDCPGPRACVPYFSLCFGILIIFFLMSVYHLPWHYPLDWPIDFQCHAIFLSTLFFICFPRIKVLATHFRMIFYRLLNSSHELSKGLDCCCIVGSPCRRVILGGESWLMAYLNKIIASSQQ